MPYTQTDLDNLKQLIASGVKEVVYNDRRLTYQDVQELLKAHSLVASEVDAGAAAPKRGLIRVAVSSGF